MYQGGGYPQQFGEMLYTLPESYEEAQYGKGRPRQMQPKGAAKGGAVIKGAGKGMKGDKGGKVYTQQPQMLLGKGLGGLLQPKGKGKGEPKRGAAGPGVSEPRAQQATLPKPTPKPMSPDAGDRSDDGPMTPPMPPPSRWTVIWCDELAFKAASQSKRDELEKMGIRVKAHKTAERCIRSLDKRAKKINPGPGEQPSAESPKTLALVTEENHELVPYLVERPVLVRNIIFLASSGSEN